MREIVHQALSNMVIQKGTIKLSSEITKKITFESIQPDVLNKEEIQKNIMNKSSIQINWWTEHSLNAKYLAFSNLKDAQKAYIDEKSDWIRFLGYSFHFITDRATPYHSPNKLLPLTGTVLEDYSNGAKALRSSNKAIQFLGGVFTASVNAIDKSFKLKTEHDDFEKTCDDRWMLCSNLILETFLHNKKTCKVSFDFFKENLNRLYQKYNNSSLNWIKNCSDIVFAEFMADIAVVMDIAVQFVMNTIE